MTEAIPITDEDARDQRIMQAAASLEALIAAPSRHSAATARRLLEAAGLPSREFGLGEVLVDGISARAENYEFLGYPYNEWSHVAVFRGLWRYARLQEGIRFEVSELPPHNTGRWFVSVNSIPLCHPDGRLIMFTSQFEAMDALDRELERRDLETAVRDLLAV
jgi:hypothetical protein